MWVVTVQWATNQARFVIQHKDGGNPASVCQALRLMRESMVRDGVENEGHIIKAEFEAHLRILSAEGSAA